MQALRTELHVCQQLCDNMAAGSTLAAELNAQIPLLDTAAGSMSDNIVVLHHCKLHTTTGQAVEQRPNMVQDLLDNAASKTRRALSQ